MTRAPLYPNGIYMWAVRRFYRDRTAWLHRTIFGIRRGEDMPADWIEQAWEDERLNIAYDRRRAYARRRRMAP